MCNPNTANDSTLRRCGSSSDSIDGLTCINAVVGVVENDPSDGGDELLFDINDLLDDDDDDDNGNRNGSNVNNNEWTTIQFFFSTTITPDQTPTPTPQSSPALLCENSDNPPPPPPMLLLTPAAVPTADADDAAERRRQRRRRRRCTTCRTKVAWTVDPCSGCDELHCGQHRYPEEHDCLFDWKSHRRDLLRHENPQIKRVKFTRIEDD